MKKHFVKFPEQYKRAQNLRLLICALVANLTVVSATGLAAEPNSTQKPKPTATVTKLATFEFKGHSLQFKLKAPRGTSVEVDHSSSSLVLSKTQSADAQQASETKVNAILISDFKGIETINQDIKSLNEKKTESVNQEALLPEGRLYTWQTPTFGSATYFYLQHPKQTNIAFKLGPFPDLLRLNYKIDWKSAKWIDKPN